MKNVQRKGLLVGLGIVLILGGAWYLMKDKIMILKNQQSIQNETKEEDQINSINTTPEVSVIMETKDTPLATTTTLLTSAIQPQTTYTNKKQEYSFKYPTSWTLKTIQEDLKDLIPEEELEKLKAENDAEITLYLQDVENLDTVRIRNTKDINEEKKSIIEIGYGYTGLESEQKLEKMMDTYRYDMDPSVVKNEYKKTSLTFEEKTVETYEVITEMKALDEYSHSYLFLYKGSVYSLRLQSKGLVEYNASQPIFKEIVSTFKLLK